MTASDAKASARMASIRQRGTSAELQVGSALRKLKLGYRKNVKTLPGSPDFANRREKWAVFVNGCYWHHHRACRRATIPKANREFWVAKFGANRSRDARSIRELRARGFRVVVVWECQLATVHDRLRKVLEPRRIRPRDA